MVEVIANERVEDRLRSFRERAGSSKPDRMLMDAVLERFAWLRKNATHGIRVRKRMIPRAYLAEEVKLLFVIRLPLFWRMLYTLTRMDGVEYVVVLDILSHEEYDLLFGYRKK